MHSYKYLWVFIYLSMDAKLRFTQFVSHMALSMSVGLNLSLISRAGQFEATVSGKSMGCETHLNRVKNHIYQ